jgi:putative MATE family efflux protein
MFTKRDKSINKDMLNDTSAASVKEMFTNNDLKRLLIPLIIEQLLMSLMGTADTIMVSNVGPAALSAVSLVDSINVLVVCLFSAMATGGTIVCAQFLGRGDTKQADNSSRQLMLSVFVLSLVLTLICFFIRGPLLRLIFGTVEEDVMTSSMIYFTITMLAYPFIAINNASSALFRAAGNSKLPMQVAVGTNILHIAVNAILIFGLNMGVTGAAAATLASRIIGAVLLLWNQHKPGLPITFDKILTIRPDIPMIKMILRIGVPTGIENTFFQLGKLIIASTVSTLGTVAISIHALVFTLEFVSSMPSIGIGLGLVTVAGSCMGAGKPLEARRYTIKLTKIIGSSSFHQRYCCFAAYPSCNRTGRYGQ